MSLGVRLETRMVAIVRGGARGVDITCTAVAGARVGGPNRQGSDVLSSTRLRLES
jgi:hypothetical protein